jgi:hypothetical protein
MFTKPETKLTANAELGCTFGMHNLHMLQSMHVCTVSSLLVILYLNKNVDFGPSPIKIQKLIQGLLIRIPTQI